MTTIHDRDSRWKGGYYFHIACIHESGIRKDKGVPPDPERGTFMDRAVAAGHARPIDDDDTRLPSCHWCIKHGHEGGKKDGVHEDFTVLSWKLAASICDCGDDKHYKNSDVRTDVWTGRADEQEEEPEVEMLICGDCWYKKNDVPPDDRVTKPEGLYCETCDVRTTELISVTEKGHVVSGETVAITWERTSLCKETFAFTIPVSDLTEGEREDLASGIFSDVAYDIAGEESNDDNMTKRERWDWDSGPEEIEWEVQ